MRPRTPRFDFVSLGESMLRLSVPSGQRLEETRSLDMELGGVVKSMTVIETILAQKVVAVVRLDDYSRAVEVARALVAGGVGVLEFTLTGQGALEAITAARNTLGDAVCVGVGTVLTPEQAEAAIWCRTNLSPPAHLSRLAPEHDPA